MSFSLFGRYDAFLLGMKADIVSNIAKEDRAKKELSSTIEKISTDFRSVYDGLVPNIHAIDVRSLANTISKDMVSNPDKYFRNSSDFKGPSYIDEKGATVYPITPLSSIIGSVITPSFLTELRSNIRERLKKYHKSIEDTGDPVSLLNQTIEGKVKVTLGILDNPDIPEEGKIDAVFNLGSSTRAAIFKIFGQKPILGITTESIGVDSKFLMFFGKSFSRMVTVINQEVNTAVSDTIKASIDASTGNFVPRGSSVGKLIHFGHSSIRPKDKTEISAGIKVLFNSPGFLKTAFNELNSASGASLDMGRKYIRKTGHLKHSILISKDINQSMGALMSIGITFTQDQLSKINLGMAPKEGLASGGGAGKASLLSTIANRNIGDMVFKRMFPKPEDIVSGLASPSLLDMLTDKLISNLSGKPTKLSPKSSSKKEGSIPLTSLVVVKGKSTVTKPKFIVKGTAQSDSSPRLRTPSGQFTSLFSLQNILNQTLHAQIRANMGTGDRKDVLNYRTGRFAGSARVERMSQSREGMVTAFYSYMRNPYGTFSTGGAQEFPKSRDPKLLISQSIREIGAKAAANRMRAVLV